MTIWLLGISRKVSVFISPLIAILYLLNPYFNSPLKKGSKYPDRVTHLKNLKWHLLGSINLFIETIFIDWSSKSCLYRNFKLSKYYILELTFMTTSEKLPSCFGIYYNEQSVLPTFGFLKIPQNIFFWSQVGGKKSKF